MGVAPRCLRRARGRRPARGDRRRLRRVPARAHARGQDRVPLRAAEPQRGVSSRGRSPASPRGDRTVAGRGLPRHRQHRMAQPGRLRRWALALRRRSAHPAPRGHPLGRSHPVPRVRDRHAHLPAGLRDSRRTDGHRARQPPFRPARAVRPHVRPGPHLRRAAAGAHRGERGRCRAVRLRRLAPGSARRTRRTRPLLRAGALRSPRSRATLAHHRCREPTLGGSNPAPKTERARTLVGLHDPFFYDA